MQRERFVTYETKGFSSEIQSIYLVDEKIGEIERYLEEKYGYEPKAAKRKYVEEMIASYSGRSPQQNGSAKSCGILLGKTRFRLDTVRRKTF